MKSCVRYKKSTFSADAGATHTVASESRTLTAEDKALWKQFTDNCQNMESFVRYKKSTFGADAGAMHTVASESRTLTAEDKALWEQFTNDYSAKRKHSQKETEIEVECGNTEIRNDIEKSTNSHVLHQVGYPIKAITSGVITRDTWHAKKNHSHLVNERRVELIINKRTKRRIAKFDLNTAATVDLHGLTQKEALFQLKEKLTIIQESGVRSVIVITGKGKHSRSSRTYCDHMPEKGVYNGTLRHAVPCWLKLPQFTGIVSWFTWSLPIHGNGGALYVALKSNRPRISHRRSCIKHAQ